VIDSETLVSWRVTFSSMVIPTATTSLFRLKVRTLIVKARQGSPARGREAVDRSRW
jgi:hypothetical protein